MKIINLTKTALIFTTLAFSHSGFSEEQSLLNQINGAAQSIQQATTMANQTSTTVSQGGLVSELVKQLGVSTEQATGGTGALFQMAKTRMTDAEFNQLSSSVPNMNTLLASVPETQTQKPTSTAGFLTALASASGNKTLVSGASLFNTFKQLDLSKDMIGQFTPILIDYVQKNSSAETANLLKMALSGS